MGRNKFLLASLVRRWRHFVFRWRREKLDRELAEEIEFHRLLTQQENQRSGFEPEAAAARSRQQMGNTTISREQCRDIWSFLRIERLLQDLRFAARMFSRTPGFTIIAVLSLVVGIGGNAAMFSLVSTLLIRPLPYRAPDRLIRMTGVYPRASIPFFRARSRAMDVAAVGSESETNLTGQGEAIRIFASAASANLFSLLGAPVALGRTFAPGEDLPGRDALVILSYSLWKAKFGGDPAVVGRVIALNGRSREIIGIMPASFSFPSSKAEVWIPMRLDPSNFLEFWGDDFITLVGRLKPGFAMDQVRGETHTLAGQFLKTFPYPMPRDYTANTTVIPLREDVIGDIRAKLIILLCSVGVVLLIACTNVASLLLSRATVRRKEIALRTALGAGRLRIVRQLLTESTLLAVLGGLLGIALGKSVLSIFKAVLPSPTPGLAQVAIDWQVAAAVAALALLTGIAFGIAPALSSSQVDTSDAIRTGSSRSAGAAWTRLRSWLIAVEVAFTMILVVTSGLLIKSLYRLSETGTGFVPSQILAIRISPNPSFCQDRAACIALYDRLLARARDIQGVTDAAIVNALPLDGGQPSIAMDIEGHPKSPEFPSPLFWAGAISPGYVPMMRIPLLSGRNFTNADGVNADRVVLISASTARHFWPGENPIGRHIKSASESSWRTIVGVVGDVRQFELGRAFPDYIPGAMYMPYSQAAQQDGHIFAAMDLMVKIQGHAERIGLEIRALAQDQNPNIPVSRITTLDDVVAGSISDFRATIRVFLCFACVAILLAAIGVYGLVSYWVSQRTFEIGVRMALGATRRRIVSMILAQGMRVALCGTLLGLAAALVATRYVASLLFGVGATDPLTFAAVTALILVVAGMATVFPAWRASQIDPTKSLRVD